MRYVWENENTVINTLVTVVQDLPSLEIDWRVSDSVILSFFYGTGGK